MSHTTGPGDDPVNQSVWNQNAVPKTGGNKLPTRAENTARTSQLR